MAVTPNYSWPVPVNTDLVKDGAEAIKDLGDAIDATVFGLPSGALTLVKTQVIGSAVTSVTVSDAFSATYDNYRIMISGGVGSTSAVVHLSLNGITTGYYSTFIYMPFGGGAIAGATANNLSYWYFIGACNATAIYSDTDLYGPFLARTTIARGALNELGITSSAGSSQFVNTSTTSATGFTITTSAGTLTGGTIRVYGYQN